VSLPITSRHQYQAPVRPRPPTALRKAALSSDWALIAATVSLCLLGALSVFAATRNPLKSLGRNPAGYLERDLINMVVGGLLATPALLLDYRRLRAIAPVLYAGVVLALLAVLSPLGTTVNGAHAWFSFGPVQLEPSEFAKPAVLLVMAAVLVERRDNETAPRLRACLVAIAAAAVPVLLILAEPALGIAIVLTVLAFVAVALGGAPTKLIVALLGAALAGALMVPHLHLIKPYQVQRFTAFTHATDIQSTVGYQTHQGELAIGSGGLFGRGFLHGQQTNAALVPEQQTDFVFTVVGEEFGFAGAGIVLGLFSVVFWRGLRIARRSLDLYGRIVAGGVVIWMALQMFVNIGMTVGIMPVTGLPLPFLSYGGSAMFVNLIAVALLLNIDRTTKQAAISS
jgi:rod shape determining protein RodA